MIRTLCRPFPSFLRSKFSTSYQTSYEARFIPSTLDVEQVEDYRPGGLHPLSIGDRFNRGRYRVIHKLGFGGSSTIWLARDDQKQSGRLVTLKAMRADASSNSLDEVPELKIPKLLQTAIPDYSDYFQAADDHFFVHGPNGTHLFLISPLAGSSLLAMSHCPGQASGSCRLRGDLALRIAKHTAQAIHRMHCAGFVHGDFLHLTTSNILFRVSEQVLRWSDADIYGYLRPPETEEVRTRSGHPRGPHGPAYLVGAIDNSRLTYASFLQESVAVIDFGQSYAVGNPPADYKPGTVMNYLSPEARFENRAGLEADVWALGCAIFEIRAGFPLFESFFGSDADILRQTIEILRRLPEPWWTSFKERATRLEEDEDPKTVEAQAMSSKSSIRARLRLIGTEDSPVQDYEGPMMEMSGVRMPEVEVELLSDLLEKLLRYRPEERIGMDEVVEHPWFATSQR
ncbi:kinase-like domain-containing protein [Mycena polygramma]|nr:kinase-like domain-containing protein [Mycena polygramma]